MHLNNRYKKISAAILLGSVILTASCKKDAHTNDAPFDTNLGDKAVLKVVNAAINTSRNYVYIDNTPISYTLLAYASSFPSVYGVTVNSGSRAVLVKDTLSTSTQNPLNFSANFEAGKHYTLFTYDTSNAVKYKLVKDAIEIPADTTARVRFANLIYSSTPIPNVDVFSARKNANIFTNVAPADITDFIAYPSTPAIDTLYVRVTGTTTTILQANSFSPTKKRSYTLVFRGRFAETTSTNTLVRTLSSYTTY